MNAVTVMPWDDESQGLLNKQPAEIVAQIEKGVKMRAKAKALEDEAAPLKEEGNNLLGPAMLASGIKKLTLPKYARITFKSGISKRLDKVDLTTLMLENGLSAETVSAIIAKATKEAPFETVEFRVLHD